MNREAVAKTCGKAIRGIAPLRLKDLRTATFTSKPAPRQATQTTTFRRGTKAPASARKEFMHPASRTGQALIDWRSRRHWHSSFEASRGARSRGVIARNRGAFL